MVKPPIVNRPDVGSTPTLTAIMTLPFCPGHLEVFVSPPGFLNFKADDALLAHFANLYTKWLADATESPKVPQDGAAEQ